MINKIYNYLKSYDALRESMRFDKVPNGNFAATEFETAIKLDIAFDCLTSEEHIETLKILEGMEELIEKENDIKEFFQKNNNPIKESFYAFYQAYSELHNNSTEKNKIKKPKFKNFLFNLYEEGN